MAKKLVMGAGEYAKGEYRAWSNGKITAEYNAWHGMLWRCYSDRFKTKHPSYAGCTASSEFKNYQYFAGWCQDQVGFSASGYCLDKDVLLKGNKLYSRDTCVFIPAQLNLLLISRKSLRGSLPVGVSMQGKYFKVGMNNGVERVHIGYYSTQELAFEAYRVSKELHIRTVAETYRHQIDERAYQALMSWTISIDD